MNTNQNSNTTQINFQLFWMKGYKLAAGMNFKFPQFSATPLASIIPSAGKEAILLMEDMLRLV